MRAVDPALFIILLLIVACGAIIIWSLTLRYRRRELQHKERLAALEKGTPLPVLTETERSAPWTPRVYLLRGLIWLFSGIALMLFLAGLAESSRRPRSMEDKVWAAQRLKEMGATDEQVRNVENDTGARSGMPLGISLIGLVPIGVGLAYLIFYRAEGANLTAPSLRE